MQKHCSCRRRSALKQVQTNAAPTQRGWSRITCLAPTLPFRFVSHAKELSIVSIPVQRNFVHSWMPRCGRILTLLRWICCRRGFAWAEFHKRLKNRCLSKISICGASQPCINGSSIKMRPIPIIVENNSCFIGRMGAWYTAL